MPSTEFSAIFTQAPHGRDLAVFRQPENRRRILPPYFQAALLPIRLTG